MAPVELMVFSDFLCPWCYVGAIRLGDIAAEEGDDVRWEWRAYLLRPEPEPRPLDAFTEYTRKWERPGALEPRARFTTWTGEHRPPSHSFPAALAAKVAASLGPEAGRAYRQVLFPAYFTDNRTISDRTVLTDIAAEAGLDADAFERAWHDHETDLLTEVWRDHGTAVQSGIGGVPAVVVNRRWLVSGAVEADQYRSVIAQAREAQQAPTGP
jgi:predicted DsbA family dithiol-disulfide isomerase